MLLGMQAVRRWATLIALSGAQDTPHELTVTALLRARLCELISRDLAPPSTAEPRPSSPSGCSPSWTRSSTRRSRR